MKARVYLASKSTFLIQVNLPLLHFPSDTLPFIIIVYTQFWGTKFNMDVQEGLHWVLLNGCKYLIFELGVFFRGLVLILQLSNCKIRCLIKVLFFQFDCYRQAKRKWWTVSFSKLNFF